MSLPYKSHPLYTLRAWDITIALIGVFLFFATIGYDASTNLIGMFFLVVSALVSGADLCRYAIKKVTNPDVDPVWPTKCWMLADVVLAVILQLVFWALLSAPRGYYYSGSPFESYATLALFICSITQAICAWKQCIARYKKKWLESLPHGSCPRCGYDCEVNSHFDPEAQNTNSTTRQELPHNVFPYDGPSALYQNPEQHDRNATSESNAYTTTTAVTVTPPCSEDTSAEEEEEGLLINTAGSAYGYGALDSARYQRDTMLEQPDEIVVASSSGKGKRAKKGSKKGKAVDDGREELL